MKDNINSKAEFYVTSPTLQKDGITPYTLYLVIGSKVVTPISRRYSDFSVLREKMVERWPGVFIPNIPHKTLIKKVDKEIVEMRVEMINYYCEKISTRDYLLNSNEIKMFLEERQDIKKDLTSIPHHTYEDLIFKYAKAFPDYEDTLDLTNANETIARFTEHINKSLPHLINFQQLLGKVRDRYLSNINDNLETFELFSLYENENIYSGSQDSRLFFSKFNSSKETSLFKVIDEFKINPYDSLHEKLSSDILDLEAFLEAIQGISSLQLTHDNLESQLKGNTTTIEKVKAGAPNIKKIFSFKSKENFTQLQMKEHEKIENDVNTLKIVISMVTYQMDREIQYFKRQSLEDYYKELSVLNNLISSSNKVKNDLYSKIISAYHPK